MTPTPKDPIQAPTTRGGLLWLVVSRPVAVTMIVLAVSVFGLVSLTKLPVNLLPEVSYPTLTVRTEYEGAAPIDVEKLITRRLEERLSVISNLVNIWSISRAGVSDVILEFEWETPMTFAAQDVREQVDQIQSQLPEGVARPLILRYDPTLDPILRIALYDPTVTEKEGSSHLYELRRLAEEEIQRKIENIPGVAAVRIRGGFEEEWRIELNEDRLKLHGISASQVRDRIAQENVNVAGGLLRDGDRENLVRTMGEITDVETLSSLVIDVKDGRPVRVEDLSDVRITNRERDVVTRVEGVESVELEIFKEATANIVEVAQQVKAALFGQEWRKRLEAGGDFRAKTNEEVAREAEKKAEKTKKGESGGGRGGARGGRRGGSGGGGGGIVDKREAPLAQILAEAGVKTRVLSDQSVFIENSLDEVQQSGLIGAGLAIIVLFAFLRRLSPTLIISVAIPVSVIATFAPLFIAKVSLNIMSLGGLALGIGMLVDSSIVVLEAISRRRDEGEGVVESAVTGTKEVGLAVLASTLTTVAVFLPIVFVEGIAGEFFRDQALSVVFSLVASLLAALFFIPMLASRRLGGSGDLKNDWRRLMALGPDRVADYAAVRAFHSRGLTGKVLTAPFEVLRFVLEFIARAAFMVVVFTLGALGMLVYGIGKVLGWILAAPLFAFDQLYRALAGLYRILLSLALRTRLLVVLASIALLYLTSTRVANIGIELVPEVHQGEFVIESQLPVGTPVHRTDTVSRVLEKAVRRALKREGIELAGLSSSAGIARDVIADAGDGAHTARIYVRLAASDDLEAVEAKAYEAIRAELAEIPEVSEPVFDRPSLFTTRTALEVQIIGPELPRIAAAAANIEERMRGLSGLTDIQSTHRAGHPELVIIPDREQLAFYDLNAGTVANLIRDKVQGTVSTRITKGDRKLDVLIRIPEQDINERKEILDLQVTPPGQPPIPLSAVATVEERPGPAEIRRVRGERAIVVAANVVDLDLGRATTQIENLLKELQASDPDLFRGVAVRIGGQSEESERSLRSMLIALVIATFLVYIVMASQFESLVHPFVILFSVPLAFVGVIFVLEFLAVKLSIVVLIGAIMLIGIVVNNAIVLVDSVNQHRQGGMRRDEAIMAAGERRLRPILMTTATTVLGLLPLALGLGEGTEIRAPMAITVIAGLVTSTALTLIVVPVMYSLFSRAGNLVEERATS